MRSNQSFEPTAASVPLAVHSPFRSSAAAQARPEPDVWLNNVSYRTLRKGKVMKNATVVLVHGAFADASGWAKVILGLEENGYSVIAVQNPLTSFADDVATTRRVIDAQTGP